MLQPYPTALNLRIRSQSNPSRPKFTTTRSSSSQEVTSADTREPGSEPASRLGTAGSTTSQSSSRPLTAAIVGFSPIQETPPSSLLPEKKHTKKLQRPRRGSLFASTSSVQLVPSSTSTSVPPSPGTSEWHQPFSHDEPPPSPNPPTRPPRNPARISLSDSIRPSSSLGGRDSKAIWDSPPQGPSESSTFPYSSSPLLNKLVKRNKSIGAKVNGRPGSAGVSSASASGSLLTKAGRKDTKEMENERSLFSRKQDLKGKGKETDQDEPPPRERSSTTLIPPPTPRPASSLLPQPPPPRRASKLHAKPRSRPHSQHTISAPPLSQTPRSSNVSRDSHSSNSTAASNSNPSDRNGAQTSAAKGMEKEKAGQGFSTLDRTILEELKHSITARESQFVSKGPGGGLGQNGEKGIRHHPFTKEEVPYPRSYDKGVVDLDVWELAWIQQMCDNVTWHVFEKPPTKVLDLGCGTGSWILECAKRWKQCHFVGLDLVPLQPDLKRVGSSSMASRITWIQANFLEGLPFPNEEFDFVHIKRIARGVPEDKWDALFDEVTRVMKPGGAFEMLEEDLYWPGKSRDADGDSDSESGPSPPLTSTTKVPSPLVGSPAGTSTRSGSPSTPRPTIRKNIDSITPPADSAKEETKPTPGPAPYRPPSPKSLFYPPIAHGRPPALTISTMVTTPSRATVNNAVAEGNIPSESSRPSASTYSISSSSTPSRAAHSHRRTSFSPSTPTTSVSMSPEFSQFSPVRPSFSYPHLVRTAPKPPVNPRDHTILETIYTEMHAMRFINLAPLSLLPNNLSTWFKDVRTHPPLNITFPPPPVHPRVRSSLAHPDAFSAPQTGSDDESGLSDLESSPVKTETAAPRGPIFHRTHSTDDSQTIRRKSLTPTSAKPASSPIISLQGLILGVSPYAYLDDARFTAFSPSGKASFMSLLSEQLPSVRDMLPAATIKSPSEPQCSPRDPEAPNYDAIMKTSVSLEGLPGPSTSVPVPGSQSAEGAAQDLATTLANFKIRLPNTTLRLDLRTLNLHLAARTSEILACAEAMWEWVLEFQAEKTKWKQNPRLKSNRVDHSSSKLQASAGPEDPAKVAIAELTRAEFDGLLTQFNLDMRDHYALGSALEERFAWSVVPMPATQDCKLFDIACDKWKQYRRQERQDEMTEFQLHPYRRHSHRRQLLSEAAATLSNLPTIPDTITMRKDSTRPAMSFTETIDAQQSNMSGRQTLSRTGSYTSLHKERPLPEPLDEPHPSHFLCRTIRVFVAWKP